MLFRRFLLTEDSMNQYYEDLMEAYSNKSDDELYRIHDISDTCCGFPLTVFTVLLTFIFPAMLTCIASYLEEIDLNVGFMAILFALILISAYISNSIKNKVASRILEERRTR